MRNITLITLILAAWFAVGAAYAQETAGIVGTVTDPTGAVVTGARIIVTEVGTGLTRTVTTSDSGDYAVPGLPVGVYNISAELTGFKKVVVENVKLDVQQTARVNLSLQVGATTEQVTVSGVAPLLQTNDSQVGSLIENKKVVDLPLNGRNFTQLNLLVAGASEGSPHNSTSVYGLGTRGSGVSFSVDGARSNYNQFLVDGVPAKEVQHESNAFSPSIDAIQEFRVQTSNYSAEFGTEAGGQINVVTKAGTNQVHGTAYEFLRNDALDARNFFAPQTPELRRNQFGGTVGGPIRKDKSFGFFSYEGTRVRKGLTQLALVPDAKLRSGDFSDLLTGKTFSPCPNPGPADPTFDTGAIFDPTTLHSFTCSDGTVVSVRNPIVSAGGQPNVIDSSRISPITGAILNQYVPGPNMPVDASGNNYVSTDTNKIDVDQFIGRLDHRFSDNDLLFGRYIVEDVRNISPKLFPTDSFRQDSRGQNVMLGFTHTFSANRVNELKIAYNRFTQNEVVGNAFHTNVVGQLGIQGLCEQPACWGVPQQNVGPFTNFGEHGLGQVVSGPRAWANEVFHFDDSFFYTLGAHSLKFGMQVNRHHDTFPEAIFPRGIFTYDGRFTSPDGSANANTAMADYLLGLPFDSLASIDEFDPNYRNTALYPWFQDDWRVTPNLTLNLGLRYEWFGRPQAKNNKISTIDYSRSPAQLVTAVDHAQFGYPRSLVNNDNNNFGPRFGFAWTPWGHKKAVIRGGYGIFYQREAANTWIDISINLPFIRQTDFQLQAPEVTSFSLSNPFVLAPPIPLLVFSIDRGWRDGQVQEWNLNYQYEVASNFVVQVGYVGNKGEHLPTSYTINQAVPGPGDPQSRRPFPNFGTIFHLDSSAASTYNSLQIQAERRFAGGLSFLGAYTWAKGLDDSGATFIGESDIGVQDVRNRRLEKGLSSQTPRQRFTFSYVYELPVGRGKHFATSLTGPANALLGGWQLNGITTFSAGHPFSVGEATVPVDVGDNNFRPDRVGDPNTGPHTVEQFFNTAAFAPPPAGRFGTAGRNIVIGPGLNVFDFSLLKRFEIGETKSVEFRAEFFDIFNHPNFIDVNNVRGFPGFGAVTSAGDPRDIQFGLKFLF